MTGAVEMLNLVRAACARLERVQRGLAADDIFRPSFADDWTIAQVFSHLGSSAEVFALVVEAGRVGAPTPGREQFAPVWESWNRKDPAQQVADAVPANRALIEATTALTETERDRWRADLFGMERDLANVLEMRMSELVVHTWDIEVVLDPTAVLGPEPAVAAILDGLAQIIALMGRPVDDARRIAITTTAPARDLMLGFGPEAPMLTSDSSLPSDGSLRLPAEAFVRLVYGRLDEAHTPPVETLGVELDDLRAVFRGV